MDELILANMELAERVGQKFAFRHSKHQDECVAESYFWLVMFFKRDVRLYHASPLDYKRLLCTYIKRKLLKYFKNRGYLENVELEDKVSLNTDQEMIEYLSGFMTDESAFKVYKYIREGINFFDIEMVDPSLIKAVKRMRLAISGRLKRLEALATTGIKPVREIKYASQLEDGEWDRTSDGGDSGMQARGTDPLDADGERRQSETSLAA